MMVIDNKFNIEQIVFLKTDPEQLPRIVYSIQVLKDGLMYQLACGIQASWHTVFEISAEKDVLALVQS
jgi:hypothetical protein